MERPNSRIGNNKGRLCQLVTTTGPRLTERLEHCVGIACVLPVLPTCGGARILPHTRLRRTTAPVRAPLPPKMNSEMVAYELWWKAEVGR